LTVIYIINNIFIVIVLVEKKNVEKIKKSFNSAEISINKKCGKTDAVFSEMCKYYLSTLINNTYMLIC